MKTVWVLGAGFSQPLGGPMLRDLFTKASQTAVEGVFGEHFPPVESAPHQLMLEMYRKGKKVYWRHAEEFLEKFDAADTGGEKCPAWSVMAEIRRTALRSHWNESRDVSDPAVALPALLLHAKQFMAAECCVFLRGVEPTSERWTPFTRWVEQLTDSDTVITFNYDRVLELLNEHLGVEKGPLHVVEQTAGDLTEVDAKTRVLKLHGSVDWRYAENDTFRRHVNKEFAISATSEQIAIATPGPHKLSLTTKLKPLWEEAKTALREAERIVFVGYRFPNTDSHALGELLGAIRANKSHYLTIETVLGPNTNQTDSVRLRELLELATVWRNGMGVSQMSCKVLPRPLYTEDYFTVKSARLKLRLIELSKNETAADAALGQEIRRRRRRNTRNPTLTRSDQLQPHE